MQKKAILCLIPLFFQLINCSQTIRNRSEKQDLYASGKIYVACKGDNAVSVIDVAENRLINKIPVDVEPRDLTVSPNQKLLAVVHESVGVLSLIDTIADTLKKEYRFPRGVQPILAEFSTDSTLICMVRSSEPLVKKPVGDLYLVSINLVSTNELDVIGQNQFLTHIKIIYSKKYNIICASAESGPGLLDRPLSPGWVIDFKTRKTLAKASGLGPYDIELSPDGDFIYSNIFPDGFIKWDLQRRQATRLAPARPWRNFEVSLNGKRLYAFGANLVISPAILYPAIFYVDLETMNEQRYKLPYQLETFSYNRTKMVLSTKSFSLYFTRYSEGLVAVFDLDQKKVVTEIAIGNQPVDLLYIIPK